MTEKIIELLKKLSELSKKGVGGEAINAQEMLDRLLKKHNMTMVDVEGEEKKNYFFQVAPEFEKLFWRICKNTNYEIGVFGIKKQFQKRAKANHIVECTAAQYIEIKQKFEIYSELLKKESEIFYAAFVVKNKLFFENPNQKESEPLTQEQEEMSMRIAAISKNISKATIQKQIENQ